MIQPEEHKREKERIRELESYSILDTLPEEDYDNLTAIAAVICGTKISLVSLLDNSRQWFKSHHGLSATETPKEFAFCAHAINDPENFFSVQDARKDERFHDNPLVTGEPFVTFYAGVPLLSENGLPIGTICVIDQKPQVLNKNQIISLKALSNQVMKLMELRRNKIELEKVIGRLEQKNRELDDFALAAAHDIKSPLRNISSLTDLLLKVHHSEIDKDGQKMLELIGSSSEKLKNLVNGLLDYSRSEEILKNKKSIIDLTALVDDVGSLFMVDNSCTIDLSSKIDTIEVNRTAIEQILINLIANAIKYNDKSVTNIEVGVSDDETHYNLYVEDNGPGIALKNQEKIFGKFEVASAQDKFGQTGNGIGLATVKRIVEGLGGSIQIDSKIGKGTKFLFQLEK